MPSIGQYVASTAILASSANAFYSPAPMSMPTRFRTGRSTATSTQKLSMVLVDKPGNGENRMTETGFAEPLVEKKEFPGTSHGYQWVIKEALNEKKLNNFEKTKKAKPGLLVFDELEELAAQAKAKGGAQNLDEADINIRLKWMGLFHR